MKVRDEILQQIGDQFTNEQIKALGDIIDLVMRNYKVERICTELSTDVSDNDAYMKLFGVEKKMEGRATRTIEQYIHAVQRFFSVIRKNFRDVTPEDTVLYFSIMAQQSAMSEVSLDNHRRYINNFFGWLHENGYIQKNPMKRIKPIRISYEKKEILTGNEIQMMRDACRTKKELAVIDFLHSTGVRVSEIRGAEIHNVDKENNCIRIFAQKTKNWRTVYLDAAAIKHLEDYLSTRKDNSTVLFCGRNKKPMNIQTYEKILHRVAKRAGLTKPCTVHTFRRTFACRMYKRGLAIGEISKILGHSKIDTTLKYYLTIDDADIQHNFLKLAA